MKKKIQGYTEFLQCRQIELNVNNFSFVDDFLCYIFREKGWYIPLCQDARFWTENISQACLGMLVEWADNQMEETSHKKNRDDQSWLLSLFMNKLQSKWIFTEEAISNQFSVY